MSPFKSRFANVVAQTLATEPTERTEKEAANESLVVTIGPLSVFSVSSVAKKDTRHCSEPF